MSQLNKNLSWHHHLLVHVGLDNSCMHICWLGKSQISKLIKIFGLKIILATLALFIYSRNT